MKRIQKGVTLVEVIVAIAVFSIISLALFSSVISMKNVVNRQEEYVKLEMVCYDIDAYWQRYGEDWYTNYFGTENPDSPITEGYLDSNFVPVSNVQMASYVIDSQISSTDESILIISIYTQDRQTTFVEELQCKREVTQ